MSDFKMVETGGGIIAKSGHVAVEQSRAVAEAQAAMAVAQARPRDENYAYTKIMKACKRGSLAATSMYAYRRGGALVEGPSIRLAETIARAWGNITYGLREIGRGDGTSEIEAFAWDLESNTKVTRQFVLRHIRDTKNGPKQLTAERDIYELAANMGQRRVRACLLELIPGDIVEAAIEQCKKTLADGDGRPMEDRIRSMLVAFEDIGVTQDMIEAFLQHKVSAIVPAQLVRLQQIYKSINDGVASRDEFFDIIASSGLNERFGAESADTATGEIKPDSSEPKKPRRSKAKKSTAKKQESKPAAQDSPSASKLRKEIDAIDNCIHLDRWRMKHIKRIERELKGDEGAIAAIMEYADKRYKALKDDAPAADAPGSGRMINCPAGHGNVPEEYCSSECKSRSGCPEWE